MEIESSSVISMEVMPTATVDPTNEDNPLALRSIVLIVVGCAVAAILSILLALYFFTSIKYQLDKKKKQQHRRRVLGGEGGSRAVKRQEMEFESFSQSLPEDSESDEFPSDEVNPSAPVIKEEDEFQEKTGSNEQTISEENELEIVNENAHDQDPATTGNEDECQTQFDRAGDDDIYDQVASDEYIEGSDSNESVNEEERDNDSNVAGNATGYPEDTFLSIDKSLEDIRKSLDDIQGALNDDD